MMLTREMLRSEGDTTTNEAVTFVVQTERVASDGGILRASGPNWSRIDSNPVVLFGHSDGPGRGGPTGGLPIGRISGRRMIDTDTGPNTGWEQDFTPAKLDDVDSDVARNIRTIWSLVRSGDLRAASLRFTVDETENLTNEQREALGVPAWGWVARTWTPLETSIVSIGADAGALKRSIETGVVTTEDLERVFRPEPYEIRSEKPAATDDGETIAAALLVAFRENTSALRGQTDEIQGLRSELIGLTDTLRDGVSASATEVRATDVKSPVDPAPARAHGEDLNRGMDEVLERLTALRSSITK